MKPPMVADAGFHRQETKDVVEILMHRTRRERPVLRLPRSRLLDLRLSVPGRP